MRRILLGCSGLVLLAFPAAASETATYTYDALGRLKTVTSVQTGQTVSRTYSYDGANNRTQRVTTISASGSPAAAPTDTEAPTSSDAEGLAEAPASNERR